MQGQMQAAQPQLGSPPQKASAACEKSKFVEARSKGSLPGKDLPSEQNKRIVELERQLEEMRSVLVQGGIGVKRLRKKPPAKVQKLTREQFWKVSHFVQLSRVHTKQVAKRSSLSGLYMGLIKLQALMRGALVRKRCTMYKR